MTNDVILKRVLQLCANAQQNADRINLPHSDIKKYYGSEVVYNTIIQGTRGYLEKVSYQINFCYKNSCYDACAVMIRRLIEILIIEVFEHFKIAHKIKDTMGDFYMLSELIERALAEPKFNLGRKTKSSLRKLKDIGDKSAHSRRYNARRQDIDKVIVNLRMVIEELIYLANLKS